MTPDEPEPTDRTHSPAPPRLAFAGPPYRALTMSFDAGLVLIFIDELASAAGDRGYTRSGIRRVSLMAPCSLADASSCSGNGVCDPIALICACALIKGRIGDGS